MKVLPKKLIGKIVTVKGKGIEDFKVRITGIKGKFYTIVLAEGYCKGIAGKILPSEISKSK